VLAVLVVAALLVACGVAFTSRAVAHPMPNTVIAVSFAQHGTTLDIAIPLPDLRLAWPGTWPDAQPVGVNLTAEPLRSTLVAYFGAHVSVQSADGVRHPQVMESASLWQAEDADVGAYQELRVRLVVPASPGFDPRAFVLRYDAVIHQVPTHYALVQVVHDVEGGLLTSNAARELGVIRYDFARTTTPPLAITAMPGSVWRGFGSVTALGFRHVLAGADHLLFLLTLLLVAPLRAVGGRWSLFQGWPYALRRFLAISLAFAVGHSVALLVGAYQLVTIPSRVVEVLIALSIAAAALHAIRPLFAAREWLVAAAFGTVHGLAFAESLTGLQLSSSLRLVTVFGFNLGVEGAQLVAMLCAVPVLFVSRWPAFHAVRVTAMTLAAAVAVVWTIQRL
jgi:HupE / UreJ protein